MRCVLMSGEVCAEVAKLAETVHEISLVLERLKLNDEGQARVLAEHREWLTSHQALMERMSANEQDHRAIHESIRAIRTTAMWGTGLAIGAFMTIASMFISHVLK